MKLVTLKEFTNITEAKIAQLSLENEGITSTVFNKDMNAVYPIFNSSLGGIAVKVLQEDLERAREIISIDLNED